MDREDMQYVTYLLENLKRCIPFDFETSEHYNELVSYVSEKALAIELTSTEKHQVSKI